MIRKSAFLAQHLSFSLEAIGELEFNRNPQPVKQLLQHRNKERMCRTCTEAGDSERQRHYATVLGGRETHMQWSHGISFSGPRESSTRGRSLAFYAFAVLAASRVVGSPVPVFVPENGFICINPPLVPGRVASQYFQHAFGMGF